MTNRSRRLPLLAIAAIAIVVLAAGCRTRSQEAFHYSEIPGESDVGPDFVVTLGEDCRPDPDNERVVLDTEATGKRGSYDQVIWVVEGEQQSGDKVVISAKPADEQDPDAAKGRRIRELFQSEYKIQSVDENPPHNAIRSGKPKKTPLLLKLLHEDKKAVWKYNIDYYRGGQKTCTYDPEICLQKPGTTGCGGTSG